MTAIINQELVETYDKRTELHIETSGNLQYMPRSAELVKAIFGTFQRTGNGTLLYTAEVYLGEHDYESEYQDDLNALKSGKVEKIY